MPTVPAPFVLPANLNFYRNEESTLTQQVCIYNPFTFDILYKVDSTRCRMYSASIRQGVISTGKKLYLEITCRQQEAAQDDIMQIQFFKWPRPRQGAKPRVQQYIGSRQIKLCVYHDRRDRERTPSPLSDRVSVGGGSSSMASGQAASSFGSKSLYQQHHPEHYGAMAGDDDSISPHEASQRLKVLCHLATTAALLLLGFLLSKTDSDWFSQHLSDSLQPHTMAIICYTLACVLIVKLLTFR